MPDMDLGTISARLELNTDGVEAGLQAYAQAMDKVTSKIQEQKAALEQLSAAAEKSAGKQANAAEKAAEKQEELAKKMDMRDTGAFFKAGTEMAVTSLKALNQVFPGMAGSLADVITQLNTARAAIQGMESTPMKWATGIAAGVSVAATLIVAGISEMKKAEEERQRAFEEGVQKSKEYANNLVTLESNIRILQNEKSTVEEVTAARQTLSNTFSDLIVGYDKEGNAILANTELLHEYIQAQKAAALNADNKVLINSTNTEADYKNAKEKFDRLNSEFEKYSAQFDSYVQGSGQIAMQNSDVPLWQQVLAGDSKSSVDLSVSMDELYSELIEAQTAMIDATDSYSNRIKSLLRLHIQMKDSLTGVTVGYYDLDAAQRLAANSLILEYTDKITQGIMEQKEAENSLNAILSDPAAMQQYTQQFEASSAATAAAEQQERINAILTDVYGQQNASVNDLAAAYKALATGGQVADATLQKLAQTFPQIKEYLQETSDLTMNYGRDLMAITTEIVTAIDFTDQVGELNGIADAYLRLADGQQLSVAQLYELAQAYPEVAEYISTTNDMSLQEGEVLSTLFVTRRNSTIGLIEDKKVEAQAVIDTTEIIIQELDRQIAALNSSYLAKMAITSSIYQEIYDSESSKLNEKKEKANEELEKQKNNVKAAQALIDALNSSSADIGSIGGSKSSSKTSTRNEALQQELKLLEQKRKMDQLTSEEELAWLQRIQRDFSMNADEKMDIEYRVYSVQKKLEQEAEKAATDRLNAEYKAIENKKKLGQLTSEKELAWLQRVQKTYRMNTEERMELEIKLYDLKKQLHEEDVKALNSLGDAVTEALKNQYEQQKKQEQDRINQSIDSWKTWEEETCQAIQGQIDALDKLEKEQESAEKRAEYEKKRQETELLLRFERDEYQRKQYQKELNRLDAEEQKRLDEEARQAEKERLQAELDKVKETSAQQQDALRAELDKLNETYDQLTSSFALRAEAEKAIMESSQKEIIQMIKSYAPEYDLAGQSIGEKLAEGFQKKAGGIMDYFEHVAQSIQSYQNSLASAANQAADHFWAARKAYDQQIAAGAAPAIGRAAAPVVMTVNFNQPVQSPVEMKRALDKVAGDLARRIGG